ncbi:glycosyltransferase family 4 protein [Desulfoscipio geothermicus]|uniref:Glycosyltransferase involved in cell wall bisynthesis n=1 Tax=Desulfoscipio geothermicus DSM 3669 TaxID=1121426 RepID=A0A1I6DLJ1_9FIRM|nr:Glycosyltransferase involved in cell wall bisynthesis [Desulfoscipio geothermicus DSM 3669]
MGLKIGIFTDSYRPYTSGVVRSIETFSAELQAQGHEIYVFAPDYHNCPKEDKVYRFSSIPAPTNHEYTLAVPFSIRLRPTLKKLNLDIIHVHSPFLLGRLGARCARKMNIPLVFTFHTLYDQYVHYVPFGQNITKEITKKFCADFCNNCDLVIVPTQVIGKHLHNWGVKTEIAAIPTGIKIDDFRTRQRDWLHKRFDIDASCKILISVGRLGKEKNFTFVLQSFKQVSVSFPETRLVLVGNGPEKENLVSLAGELGINDKVIFTGTLAKEEIAKAYNSADIFVFASVTETQGLVIGEAKAAGLPVVAVKAFGTSEMVEDGIDGFLTDLNTEHFVDKISLLLRNENKLKLLGRNAATNAEKISSQNCANRLVRCYKEVIEKNKKNYSYQFRT